MDKQFIKVGVTVFNINNINTVVLDSSDGCVNVFTSDCTDTANHRSEGYVLTSADPETQAFIAWLTSSERCIDVMAPEPTIDTPNVVTDASGIRWEV